MISTRSRNHSQATIIQDRPSEPFNEPEMGIDEKIERCVFDTEKPMENAPPLYAKELGSIGRCITFTGTTTADEMEFQPMVYKGLLCMITNNAITLLHVTRFTPSDFEAYEAAHAGSKAPDENSLEGGSRSPSQSNRTSAVSRMVPDGGDVVNPLMPEVVVSEASRREVKSCCTMGPIPCLTFSRMQIRHVRFAANPPSSFYSLFCIPEKRSLDLQFLRMFVRRYIVHTCQNDNPNGITLKHFVQKRCNWVNIDRQLLERVAKEELRYLLEEDEKIISDKTQGERGAGDVGISDVEPGRLVLLYTGIPRYTSSIASFIAILAIFGSLYFCFTAFLMGNPTFIVTYTDKFWFSVFRGFICCIPSIILSTFHASKMSPPLESQLSISIARVLMIVIGILFSIWSIISLFHYSKSSTMENYYVELGLSNEKCNLFSRFRCSGWATLDPELSNLCEVPLYNVTCDMRVVLKISTIIVPIICTYACACVLLLADSMCLVAALYYIRQIDLHRVRLR